MDLGGIRIIDAHIHQWDPLTTPRNFGRLAALFRYLPVSPGFAIRLAPRRDREFVGEPTPYLRPYLPADYRDDLAGLDVQAVVHVEAEWAGKGLLAEADETRWVASLPFGVDTPLLGSIIGKADPAAGDFGALLEAHESASPLFRGIRANIANHPDPDVRSFAPEDTTLTSTAFLDGFAELAERDLLFEAWVYSQQLPQVTALAARYPETTIVLDHLGTPAGIFGRVGSDTGASPEQRQSLFLRWCDELAAVADQPNVIAKVSGLMMPVLGHPVPRRGTATTQAQLLDRIEPLVGHVLEVFGTERMVWGSNFPIDEPIGDITNSAGAVAAAIADHLARDTDVTAALRAVFGDNARDLYRLHDVIA